MNPLADYLCPPGFAGPSALRALAAEMTLVREAGHLVFPRAARSRPGSDRAPTAGSHPVLLIPGFLAGDATLAPIAARLRSVGYRTFRSRVHANVRCAQATGGSLERRLEEISDRWEKPVALVGHSLGGLLAKGLAHRRPELVAGVVTLGSPLLAPGAVHPVLAFDLMVLGRLQRLGFGDLMGDDCTNGECARMSWEELSARPPAGFPFTSIYSRRDGIVDWHACLDPAAVQVEVDCSHVGMAVDKTTHRHVLQGLGRIADGGYRPRGRAPAATAG